MKLAVTRQSVAVPVAAAIGLSLRARVAYQGSIWADEGSFLNVLAAPSWREMLAFLRFHESHPPLFYLLMRVWYEVVGRSDAALLILPVLIGTAIVPAMYLAGRRLFSRRVGVIAGLMAAVAPQLIEHSSQLRPYGLLSLSALGSVAALAACLTGRSRRPWIVYILSTAVMVYTHNWAWMIVAGELCAALLFLRSRTSEERRMLLLRALWSWLVIAALYSPWISAFLFQTRHAGHGALPIESLSEYVGYTFFSINVILETLIVGHLARKETVAIVAMIGSSVVLGWTTARYVRRERPGRSEIPPGNPVFLIQVVVFALLAALLVSPSNNLILPRTVATVMPILLLAAAYWVNEIVSQRVSRRNAQIGAAVLGFAAVAAAFETAALLERPRSNVGAIADVIRTNAQPDDMLIVAPEWFAASFDHYFPASIEQIDYPYDGRAAMIDFANVWKTRTTSGAVQRINLRLQNARQGERRVWFVFERRYTRKLNKRDLAKAYRNRQPGIFSVQDVRRIRATLDSLYGPPKKIFEANDPLPTMDELLAYLYAR